VADILLLTAGFRLPISDFDPDPDSDFDPDFAAYSLLDPGYRKFFKFYLALRYFDAGCWMFTLLPLTPAFSPKQPIQDGTLIAYTLSLIPYRLWLSGVHPM